MTGAEALVATLVNGGVEVCFANPGTSEMHIVHALDRLAKVRCVLGLFEGVVTGAADGYARMAGKPACTLLHLAPGLSNGLANLHNASRAHVPLLNLVGQHATQHLRFASPLKGDIEAVAGLYSKWLRTSSAPEQIGQDAAAAIVAARTAPEGTATLIVPADVAWSDRGSTVALPPIPQSPLPTAESVEHAARILRSDSPAALLLSGNGLYSEGLIAAGRIAAGTGARLLTPYGFTRIERGAGRAVVDRIPYDPEQAADFLKDLRHLILVGADPPVAHFAHRGKASELAPRTCELFALATPTEDCAGALRALAEALSLHSTKPRCETASRPPLPSGSITLPRLANAIAALLPEGAIVADESMTSGRGIMAAARGAPRHDWLANTGGSIGFALPLAVGAAIACLDRRVLSLTADGSGIYTLQALWTIAREELNVTTVIFANRAYAILYAEFDTINVGQPGEMTRTLFDLIHPELDWVMLSRGLGVPAFRVDSMDEFCRVLRKGFEEPGPKLIEVVL